MANSAPIYDIHTITPHDKQRLFIESAAKRKIVRAGRRGGKTVGAARIALNAFLDHRRVLYAAPTQDQIERFWLTVMRSLEEPIDAGVLYKNETKHIIEVTGTENRIRAKTAFNADTLRGDYADLLILDEWQLMSEDAWNTVGAPMLLDNNGDAVFIYTPPSLNSRSMTKAKDPQHAAKLFKKALQDDTGRWAAFNFTSHDNPHISKEALGEIARDMTSLAYRQEIMAEDIDEAPGALWTRKQIEDCRIIKAPEMDRIIVGVDPSATSTGDEAGIVVDGSVGDKLYLLDDKTIQGSPHEWATAAVRAYHQWEANKIVAEKNNGGEMVQQVIKEVDASVPVDLVWASRGKATRAEPIAAVYEDGRAYHVGTFEALEDEMCLWTPGDPSPNRMDAHVWAASSLILNHPTKIKAKATTANYIMGRPDPDDKRPGF